MSTFNFKVNDKVANEGCGLHEFIIITAIGEGYFLGKRNTEHFGFSEEIWNKSLDWLPYTPPKKTVRMAQGVVKSMNGEIWLHLNLFPSRESADKYLSNRASETKVIIWPHTVNGIEQWVDLPVEE